MTYQTCQPCLGCNHFCRCSVQTVLYSQLKWSKKWKAKTVLQLLQQAAWVKPHLQMTVLNTEWNWNYSFGLLFPLQGGFSKSGHGLECIQKSASVCIDYYVNKSFFCSWILFIKSNFNFSLKIFWDYKITFCKSWCKWMMPGLVHYK